MVELILLWLSQRCSDLLLKLLFIELRWMHRLGQLALQRKPSVREELILLRRLRTAKQVRSAGLWLTRAMLLKANALAARRCLKSKQQSLSHSQRS